MQQRGEMQIHKMMMTSFYLCIPGPASQNTCDTWFGSGNKFAAFSSATDKPNAQVCSTIHFQHPSQSKSQAFKKDVHRHRNHSGSKKNSSPNPSLEKCMNSAQLWKRVFHQNFQMFMRDGILMAEVTYAQQEAADRFYQAYNRKMVDLSHLIIRYLLWLFESSPVISVFWGHILVEFFTDHLLAITCKWPWKMELKTPDVSFAWNKFPNAKKEVLCIPGIGQNISVKTSHIACHLKNDFKLIKYELVN